MEARLLMLVNSVQRISVLNFLFSFILQFPSSSYTKILTLLLYSPLISIFNSFHLLVLTDYKASNSPVILPAHFHVCFHLSLMLTNHRALPLNLPAHFIANFPPIGYSPNPSLSAFGMTDNSLEIYSSYKFWFFSYVLLVFQQYRVKRL